MTGSSMLTAATTDNVEKLCALLKQRSPKTIPTAKISRDDVFHVRYCYILLPLAPCREANIFGNLATCSLMLCWGHPAFLGTLLSSGACLLELCSSKACLWKAFIKEPCTYIMLFTSLNTFLCSVCGLVWFWSLALKTLETHCCRDSS